MLFHWKILGLTVYCRNRAMKILSILTFFFFCLLIAQQWQEVACLHANTLKGKSTKCFNNEDNSSESSQNIIFRRRNKWKLRKHNHRTSVMKFVIQILVKDLQTPAEYSDKTRSVPFAFHIEAQHQNNCVLNSTYKNLLSGNKRNGLLSVSKPD